MKPVHVYCLRDAQTGEVFYVGSTQNLHTRRSAHGWMTTAGRVTCGASTRTKVAWKRRLFVLCPLQTVDPEQRDEIEDNWIRFFRVQGCPLENVYRNHLSQWSEALPAARVEAMRQRWQRRQHCHLSERPVGGRYPLC